MEKQEVKVDIIIPVYNAYEYTKKCIETVISNTDLKQHTLVAINDKSPDDKILPMLKKFESDNPTLNICVIDNEENYGFVKTVNVGMKRSQNDVILLNSDTEVTANWLEKMQKVAYIQENVATVTPLSNNATLASIPNFLEENDLPNYINLETYAQSVEECSFNEYPELTTAHGFCMYIRRNAITKVGLFDDVTFEKGYGEENDFSYRCIRGGFVNLLCDNTFIYHKGTQSFSAEKQEFIQSHLEILQKKYPQNFEMNTHLCMTNPYSYVQDNVKYAVGNKYRKNVLIIAHEFMKKENKLVGGTVLHIYDLIEHLRDQMNFHVLYPENGKFRVRSFFENGEAEVILGKVTSYENIMTHNYEYRKLVEKVFDFINVDFVHVHHLMYQYFDIMDIIQEKKIPYMVTLHDFYFVCPTFVLLENNEKYCVDNEKRDCAKCLKKLKNLDDNFIEKWRELSYRVLKNAELVVTPTESAKEIVQKYFPDVNIKSIEHGVEKLEYEYQRDGGQAKKNIAFLGGINKIKGVDFLKDFIEEANREDGKYVVHLFGSTCEEDLNKSDGNYIFHGKYNREDVVKTLKENQIDLVVLLAIWPETYSYTLTESLMAEIPVLALDYGALSERISKYEYGWLLDRNVGFEDILKKLDAIFENQEDYERKISNIQKYLGNLKSSKEMAEEYGEIYQRYLKEERKIENPIDKNTFKSMLKYSKEIIERENELQNCYRSLTEYHDTVMEYRKEIERLNGEIENYQVIEGKYNHLISSRKLNLLKKIKFIEF